MEKARAKKRQATSTGGKDPQLQVNLPEADKGRARDIAAKKANVSGRQVDKIETLLREADYW